MLSALLVKSSSCNNETIYCAKDCFVGTHRLTLAPIVISVVISLIIIMFQVYVKSQQFKEKYKEYEDISKIVQNGRVSQAQQMLSQTTLLQDNFAKFEITLDSGVQTIKEIKVLSIAGLFAQVGGVLNLYSGISMLVFVEVVDLLVKLCLAVSRRDTTMTVTAETQDKK